MQWTFSTIADFLTKSTGMSIFTIQDQDYFNGLVQEKLNSSVSAIELRLSYLTHWFRVTNVKIKPGAWC